MSHGMSQGSNAMWEQAVNYAYSANAGTWSRTTSHTTSTLTLTQTDDALGRPGSLAMLGAGNDGWATPIAFGWAGDLYTGRSQAYQTGTNAGAFDPDPIRESRRFDGFGRLRRLAYKAVDIAPSTGQPVDSSWGQGYCLGPWQAECAEPLASSDFKWNTMDQLVSFDQKLRPPIWADGSQTTLMVEEDRRQRWRGYAYSKRGYLMREYDSHGSQTAAHQALANHGVSPGDVEAILTQSSGQVRRWNWERDAGAGDLNRIVQQGNPAAERWRHMGAGGSNARKVGHELVSVAIEGASAQPIAHDGRGRISQDTHFEYAWDGTDRLVAAKRKGHNVWEEVHHYDAQGRLVYTERGQAAERFVHDGEQKVAMLDGTGALVWQAAWGPGLDELVWWRDVQAGQGYLPLGDGQKSVVGLWHQRSASLSHARSFDALGRATLWNPDETPGCEELGADEVCDWQPSQARFGFGWHSAWRSPLTGLVQMRQRWYSPGLGQFLSPDPLEYVNSHNLWAFAGQDPINGWDPFGLSSGGFTEQAGECGLFCELTSDLKPSDFISALEFKQKLGQLLDDQEVKDRRHTERVNQRFGTEFFPPGTVHPCELSCIMTEGTEAVVSGIETGGSIPGGAVKITAKVVSKIPKIFSKEGAAKVAKTVGKQAAKKKVAKALGGNVDDFMKKNHKDISRKMGKKNRQWKKQPDGTSVKRSKYPASREGTEAARKDIEETLKNPTKVSDPFITSSGKNEVVDVYSKKTGSTVRVRQKDNTFETLIDEQTFETK